LIGRLNNFLKETDFTLVSSNFGIKIEGENEHFIKFESNGMVCHLEKRTLKVNINKKTIPLIQLLLNVYGKEKVLEFLIGQGLDIKVFTGDNFLDFHLDADTISYNEFLSVGLIRDVYERGEIKGACILQADTGSGKTYGMVKNRPNDQKIIFLTPFKAQTEQCSEEYGGKCIIGMEEGFSYPDIALYIEDDPDLIFCVYDKFEELIKALNLLGINLKEYVLIVDEFHQFIWDSSDEFRGHPIDFILDNKDLFSSWIAITATPFGLKGEYISDAIVAVNKNKKSKMNGELQVVELDTNTSNSNELIDRLAKHVKKTHVKNTQSMFMCESKKQAEKLSKHLNKIGSKSGFVTSENKTKSDIYESIIKESKLPKEYDVVVFTSLVKSAVNIRSWKDKPIGNIYINLLSHHKSNKYDVISQFPARARDGFSNLFIYNVGKKYFEREFGHNLYPKLFDLSEEIEKTYSEKKIVAEKLNSIEFSKWEKKDNTYIHFSPYVGFKVRAHQIIRQKYTPILYNAIMYNDEVIHYIMKKHGYTNIKGTIHLSQHDYPKIKIEHVIQNIKKDLVFTVRGVSSNLDTSKLPLRFRISWEEVPYEFRNSSKTSECYRERVLRVIRALENGIESLEDLVKLVNIKSKKKIDEWIKDNKPSYIEGGLN
jgi:virulence-associated protein VapD